MASARVKVLLLIFILGMPVLIYLFLQGFGENKYDVPVFFQEGFPIKQGCPDSEIPHRIDKILTQGPCENWNCSSIDQKLVLFSFIGSDCQNNLAEIARVCNRYKDESKFRAVTLSLDTATNSELMKVHLKQYQISPNAWQWWSFDPSVNSIIECGFDLVTDCALSQQVILVDPKSQIRGYYQVDDPEELDRLVTEILILLNEEKV